MKILLTQRFEEAVQINWISLLDLIEINDGEPMDGEEILNAVFALSNDPSMQEHRDRLWHGNRSLSVGDIIIVLGNVFEVAPIGFNHVLKNDPHLETIQQNETYEN